MPAQAIEIPCGDRTLPVTLPESWETSGVMEPQARAAVADAGLEAERQRGGAKISTGIYGVPVAGMADVLITGSHPMDQDLRQGVKALANMVRACVRAA